MNTGTPGCERLGERLGEGLCEGSFFKNALFMRGSKWSSEG